MVDYHYDALMHEEHSEELSNLGVSENDAFMFLTWQFGDDEYLTADLMNRLIAIEPKGIGYVDLDFIEAWVANIYNTIFTVNLLVIGLLIVIGIFITDRYRKGRFLNGLTVLVSQAVVIASVLFYYQYNGRWSHRVVYTLLIGEFILFIYLLYESGGGVFEVMALACIIILLLFSIVKLRLENEFDYQEYKRTSGDFPELISYIQENKDNLFVADMFTMQPYDVYNVFCAAQTGQFDNFTTVGCAYTNSPFMKPITESFGYSNPFKALEGRDEKVLLIDNNFPDRKITYCNEHGDGMEYELEKYDNIGNLNIYRIR